MMLSNVLLEKTYQLMKTMPFSNSVDVDVNLDWECSNALFLSLGGNFRDTSQSEQSTVTLLVSVHD